MKSITKKAMIHLTSTHSGMAAEAGENGTIEVMVDENGLPETESETIEMDTEGVLRLSDERVEIEYFETELTGMAGSLTGGDSGNYILVLTGKGSVTPRHVTVTADEQSKQRGDDDPILTWKHTGGILLKGDSIDGTLVREPGEEVGDYTILNDTLQVNNPNYILHYVENLLHITENPRDNQPERIPSPEKRTAAIPPAIPLMYSAARESGTTTESGSARE